MQKFRLARPVLFMFYALPGSGKTFFSRQMSELLRVPHLSSDRLRYELFEKPSFSKEEQAVVQNVMLVMAEECLKLGISVLFDMSINRFADRRLIRDFARKYDAQTVLIWLQADQETCLARAKNRDRRKHDDKYAADMTPDLFEAIERSMQPPQDEDPLVISGKHLFESQKNVVLRRLREQQLLDEATANQTVPKPELVNLVSRAQMTAGRVDANRRNLMIS